MAGTWVFSAGGSLGFFDPGILLSVLKDITVRVLFNAVLYLEVGVNCWVDITRHWSVQ